MTATPDYCVQLVQEFWRLMATNDFHSVASILGDDFVLEWPQSRERIRGAGNFAQMNAEYPANGPWRFSINRIVGQGGRSSKLLNSGRSRLRRSQTGSI
jgi:hypothetical protein